MTPGCVYCVTPVSDTGACSDAHRRSSPWRRGSVGTAVAVVGWGAWRPVPRLFTVIGVRGIFGVNVIGHDLFTACLRFDDQHVVQCSRRSLAFGVLTTAIYLLVQIQVMQIMHRHRALHLQTSCI